MKTSKWLLLGAITLSSTSALAKLPDLQGRFNLQLISAQERLNQVPNSAPDKSCNAFYSKLFRDGQLDISAGIGYFDATSVNFSYMGREYDDIVLDPYAYAAFVQMLQSRCNSRSNFKACGFDRSLSKTFRTRSGQNVRVKIRLAHGASSANNSQNASNDGQMSGAQAAQSKRARGVFFGGIQSGTDVAIYMGHARSGGGPDFYPPRLLSNGSVNYGYYKSTQEGIRTLLGSLRQAQAAGRAPMVVGLLACKSAGLFSGAVANAAPGSLVVSARDLFNDVDIFPTGLALIDSLLNERCDSSFVQGVKVAPGSARHLQMNYAP